MSTVTEDLPQGRDRAAEILRGVSRFLAERDECSLAEFTLKSGRRVDLIALDRKGIVTVVEIKSSVADYRSDKKWHEYLEYCDRFFFAVAADFPLEMLPETCGVILADGFGASVPSRAARGHVECGAPKGTDAALCPHQCRSSSQVHRS